MKLCRNAYLPAAWYCYHFAGRVTPGTELPLNESECRACQKVSETREELPSWMGTEDE